MIGVYVYVYTIAIQFQCDGNNLHKKLVFVLVF